MQNKFLFQLSLQFGKSFFLALFFSLFVHINVAQAAVVPDVSMMIENLSKSLPNLMRMVTAIGYVLGFFFVIRGILLLKEYGESRTMMSSSHSLKGPLIYFLVGAALIYLPSSVRVGFSTFGLTTPYAYIKTPLDPWTEFVATCLSIIQLIGVIAFIRGMVILTHLGGQGGQPGTFAKALAHIIAGVLCINIYQFVGIVGSTVGLRNVWEVVGV